jgi:hypothetical protein
LERRCVVAQARALGVTNYAEVLRATGWQQLHNQL